MSTNKLKCLKLALTAAAVILHAILFLYITTICSDPWSEIIGASLLMYSLPIYCTLVQPISAVEEEEQENVSKECRAAARAYCLFVIVVCCTVASVAAADWIDLVRAETILAFLNSAVLDCVTHFIPRIFMPELVRLIVASVRDVVGYLICQSILMKSANEQ
ncbi:hypothetical protein PENTCL1PPCAC_22284 [Pristionchus entomophagus]|uniref:G protein-coupled receptor n=1 Tax=Pristionchus entomophagus TaxID=358040 RepID=A0AAV5TZZ0_9BILA|nr:hypothetical protein PENTCL1PPCAC_22284 [Pristionchus entomophagus]